MVWENIASGGLGFIGAERQNSANKKESRTNRQFQERMSSTAYQRTMADMKEAGLNPMLAAKLGGASTPGGAQATMENTLNSAADAAANLPSTRNTNADTQAKIAQQKLTKQQEIVAQNTAENLKQTNTINSVKEEMARRGLEALNVQGDTASNAGDVIYEAERRIKQKLKNKGKKLGGSSAKKTPSFTTGGKSAKKAKKPKKQLIYSQQQNNYNSNRNLTY